MQMGRQFKQRFQRGYDSTFPEEEEDPVSYARPPHGTCRVQVVRSVSDWSHGVLTERSVQNACEPLAQPLGRRLLSISHFILQIFN
jgi:phospholipase D1/2